MLALDFLIAEARAFVERKEALPLGSIVTRKNGLQYMKTSNGWRRHKKYSPPSRRSRGAKQGHRTREFRAQVAKATGVKIVAAKRAKPKLVKVAKVKR